MVDFKKPIKSWGLDFWAKAIAIFMAISIFIGHAFLNGYYAAWWGFTDYSISKAVCVVVMIWLALVVYLAYKFGRIFDSAVEKLERSKYWKWIVVVFVPAFLWILPIIISRLPYTRQLATNHQIYLSPGQLLPIYVCILYVFLFLILTLPISWLREFNKERGPLEGIPISQKAANRSGGLHFLQIAICVPAIFVAFYVFSGTYLLIPARYGGGKPDPIQFWVPRSAQAIFSGFSCQIAPDRQNNGQTGTVISEAEYLHYSNFYLVHEGSDNLILISATCDQVLQVPKDLAKGRQWRNPSFIAAKQEQAPAAPVKAIK
jgi:hypothetical protein